MLNAGQSTTDVPKKIEGDDNVQVRKLSVSTPAFLKHTNFTRRQCSFSHLVALEVLKLLSSGLPISQSKACEFVPDMEEEK